MSQTRLNGGTLVVFPGALGDFVCFLPALRAIRESGPKPVTLLCNDALADLARLAGADEILSLAAPAASWLFSSDPPADAAAVLGSFEAVHSFSGAGVPEVATNLARWCERPKISPFRSPERIHAALHFLREVAGPDVDLPRIELEIPERLRARALARHPHALNNRPLLLVHPGSGGKAKRWSEAGFRSVIGAWQRDGGRVTVLLGPAEREEAAEWSRDGASVVVPDDACELAAILAAGDAYLGNDSGPTHLASAVGARGLALFGESDVERWRPLGVGVEVVRPTPWARFEEAAPNEAKSVVWQALTRAISASIP